MQINSRHHHSVAARLASTQLNSFALPCTSKPNYSFAVYISSVLRCSFAFPHLTLPLHHSAVLFPCNTIQILSIPLLCDTQPIYSLTLRIDSVRFHNRSVKFDSIPFHDNTKLRHQRYSLTDLHSAIPLPFHTVPVHRKTYAVRLRR